MDAHEMLRRRRLELEAQRVSEMHQAASHACTVARAAEATKKVEFSECRERVRQQSLQLAAEQEEARLAVGRAKARTANASVEFQRTLGMVQIAKALAQANSLDPKQRQEADILLERARVAGLDAEDLI